jgi:hypothetical protein
MYIDAIELVECEDDVLGQKRDQLIDARDNRDMWVNNPHQTEQ